MANTSLPNLTERTATANSDLIHVNSGGTDYKETKANFLSDVNSSITSLNNSLTNSSLKFADHSFTNITIASTGYAKLGSIPTDFGVSINNFFVGFIVRGWSGGNGGAISVFLASNGTDVYILGTPNSIVQNINVRLWYVKSASN